MREDKYGVRFFKNPIISRSENKQIGIYKAEENLNQFEFIRLIENDDDLKALTAISSTYKNKIKVTSIALSDTAILDLYNLLGHYIYNKY